MKEMDKFVCRLCLYTSQNITTFRTVEKVKKTLELLVPEIKPNITKDSIICTQCYYFLKNIENFKQKWIDNQKMLLNHNVLTHPNSHFFSAQRSQIPQYAWPIQSFYDGRHEEVREREANSFQNVGTQGAEIVPEQSTVNFSSISVDKISATAQQKQDSKPRPTTSKQLQPSTSKQPQRISVIKNSRNVDDKKRVEKYSDTIKKVNISKHTFDESNEFIVISDEEVEINDESKLCYNDFSDGQYLEEADDVFEEKPMITIVKNEPDTDENPSFFNKKSEEGFYDCKLCKGKYKSSEGLYKHTMTDHNDLKFFHCNLCNFFSLWKSALSRHESLFHVADDDCYRSSRTPPPEDPHPFLLCYHCTFRTKSKDDLIKHIQVHFNDRVSTFTCCLCRRNFHSKERYDSHIEAHEKGKIVSCAHCKQFYTQKYLRQHLTEAHGVLYQKYSMYQH